MRLPLLIVAALMLLAAPAQSPTASARKFEAASIKRCRDADVVRGGAQSPGRIELVCLTTANLIRLAYLVFPTGKPNAPVSPSVFQQPISGGPSWIDSERYRIDAKAEGPENIEMMRGPMLEALLEDRFKLKLHRETKQIAVYELTVAKRGPKLQAAKAGACVAFDRNNPPPAPAPGQQSPLLCGFVHKSAKDGFDIPGVTMAGLCRQLTAYVDRDIVDQTGITGVFDVHLELAPADLGYPPLASDVAPASPRALYPGRWHRNRKRACEAWTRNSTGQEAGPIPGHRSRGKTLRKLNRRQA